MHNACLVTWVASLNFGTNLQAFALYHRLNAMGYKTCIAQNVKLSYTIKDKAIAFCSAVGIVQLREFLEALFTKRRPIWSFWRSRRIHTWCQKNLRLIPCSSRITVNQLVDETDTFISGSDQIWNTWFNFDPAMFLDFADRKKRISYASSIGTNSVCPVYAEQVKSLLNQFDHISVREPTAVSVLSKLTGRSDITHAPDPTFLLSRDEWLEFCDRSKTLPPKASYALCYMLGKDPSYPSQIHTICKSAGISKVIVVPSLENPDFTIPKAQENSVLDPFEFVNLIANAKLVLTDSFHATCMSLILQKNFVEFLRFKDTDEHSQNSRIQDLLSDLNLSHHFYASNGTSWRSNIDYAAIQAKLDAYRTQGLEFLVKSMKSD